MTKLKVRQLSLQVCIGANELERAQSQEVRISVELRFRETPIGLWSDQLEDTICYEKICQAFRGRVAGHQYVLVEKLAGDLMDLLQRITEGRAEVAIDVEKVAPPIEGLQGGVLFHYGDF